MHRRIQLAGLALANVCVLAGAGLAIAAAGPAAATGAAARPTSTLLTAATTPAVSARVARSTALTHRPSGAVAAVATPAKRSAKATPRTPAAPPAALPKVPAPHHAVAPTALIIPRHRAAPQEVAALVKRRKDVSVLLAGTVKLAGATTSLLGVAPASFRWFTPTPTRRSNALWKAVQHGNVAISYALAEQRHLHLGQLVSVGGQRERIGAEADFGLAQAGVVVDQALARTLGARAEELVLGRADPSSLASSVSALLGRTTVVNLEPPAPPPPAASSQRPTTWHQLYIDAAATCPGLSWTVLAAIGQVESGDGANDGPSTAGALGPMQFEPSTWAEYGYDPFGTAKPNILDPVDAVYSAARMLCSDGASSPAGLPTAVFAYNHATWYVTEVLRLAAAYKHLYG